MSEMSKRMKISHNRIDKVFQQMHERKISVGKNRMSKKTIDNYKNRVKKFLWEVNGKFGISDITKVKDYQFDEIFAEKIKDYHAGRTSEAFSMKTTLAALKAFNHGVKKTSVFPHSKKFEVGKVDDLRQQMKKENVYRRSSHSSVLKATPEESESVINQMTNSGYKTKTRQIAIDASYLMWKTGGRISATLGLKKRDFKRVDDEGGKITFKDKGGLTRTIEIDDETVRFLELLTSDLKSDQDVFDRERQNKTMKSVEQLRKDVSKIIKIAAITLEKTAEKKNKGKDGEVVKVEINQTFSAHSFRKTFALERTKKHYDLLKSDKDAFLKKKMNENTQLVEKLETAIERINSKRSKSKKSREMTLEELAIFFTSVDLGHFRNDVITMNYCTFDDVKKYYGI